MMNPRTSAAWMEMDSVDNLRAIRYRLRKGFPEVAACFAKLRSRSIVAYAAALSKERRDHLIREIRDLFAMGWSEQQTMLVVTSILGLDHKLINTGESVSLFLAKLADELDLALLTGSPST